MSRVGQIWRISRPENEVYYLVLDEGVREDYYKRTLYRAMNMATGDVTDLQEVDGNRWEDHSGLARFG